MKIFTSPNIEKGAQKIMNVFTLTTKRFTFYIFNNKYSKCDFIAMFLIVVIEELAIVFMSLLYN